MERQVMGITVEANPKNGTVYFNSKYGNAAWDLKNKEWRKVRNQVAGRFLSGIKSAFPEYFI